MDPIAPPGPAHVPPIATLCARALALRHRDRAGAAALAREAVARSGAAEPALGRRALAALGACLSADSEALLRGRTILREVLADCDAEGDDWLGSEVRNELGAGHVSTGDGEEATAYLQPALELARRLGRAGEEVRALRLLGTLASERGEFAQALTLLLDALGAHERMVAERAGALDDALHWERGTLFGRIGIVYSNLDQFEQAISYYRVALESFEDRYPARAARTYYRMGIAAEELGELDRAARYYGSSFELNDRAGERVGRAVSLLGVGNVHQLRGRLDEAEAALGEALETLQGDPVHRLHRSDALWMLARVHIERGDPDRALPLLEEAREQYVEAERPPSHAAGLHELLFRVHELRGDVAAALEHHRAFHRLTVQHLQDRADARLTEMMARFDTERAIKEGEISRLRSEELEREIAERRTVEAELAAAKAELEARNRELHALTIRDPLTGLYNRRYLDERLVEMFALARRRAQPLSVMIFDIDDFKRINDAFSHAVGDEVLRAVAGILRASLRRSDVAARFGGEEFVVLFAGTSLEEARLASEKLSLRISGHAWDRVHPGVSLTISAGVAAADGQPNHERLLADADRKLYQAKARGKARVVA